MRVAARWKLVLPLSALVVALGVGIATAGGGILFDGGTSPSPGPDVLPSPVEDKSGAIADAQAYLASEMARVDEGQASFEEQLATSPEEKRQYLVSLSPSPAIAVLSQLEELGIHPTRVFSWTYSNDLDSIPPIVATFTEQGPYSFKDSPGAVQAMEADVVFNLEMYVSDLKDAAGSDEEGSDARIQSQAEFDDASALLDLVKTEGLAVFGFECQCTPAQLDKLQGLHVAEAESTHQVPVKPAYPVEERLISGGAP